MKRILVYIISSMLVICSCSNKKTANAEEENLTVLSDEKAPEEPEGILKLDLFSQTSNYKNNISEIAAKVEYIPLDNELFLNDFRIMDIALSDEYMFLLDIYEISQYDRKGKFIRYIGSRGGGPGEFNQLKAPLQLDDEKGLLYASDGTLKKIFVYQFDGTFVRNIPTSSAQNRSIALIDTTTIAIRTGYAYRSEKNAAAISFINYDGKHLKTYPSRIYPLPDTELRYFGPDCNFIWSVQNRFYSLEYGSDTIYRIIGDSLIPARVLTGNLKLETNELANRNKGRKLTPASFVTLPNAGVFESDYHIIFMLLNDYESFYKVYEKRTNTFFRTFYDDYDLEPRTDRKRMNYFVDDMVSGLRFSFKYQSDGKVMAVVTTEELMEKKKEILHYIAEHPSQEGEKLKAIVEKMNEMDNSLIMITTLK